MTKQVAIVRSAIQFIIDNTNGNLVESGNIHGRNGDGLIYKTIDGITYKLNKEETKRLERRNFTPRFVKGAKE